MMADTTQSQQTKTKRKQAVERLKAAKFSRFYLLLLLLLGTLLFYMVIKYFLITILLATVFTALFYPLYEKLLIFFRQNKTLSAAVCCLILFLGMIIPVYFVADQVSQEAINLFNSVVPQVKEIIRQGDAGPLGKLKRYPLLDRIDFEKLDWQSSVQDLAKNAGNIIANVINKTSKETFQVVTNLFITLFTMFYFFRDGDKLLKRLKYLSPLDDVYEEGLIIRFISVSRATVKGTLLIGLIQGTIGGVVFWICGIEAAILWTVVMVMLSVIPLVGSWLVLYPAAIIKLLTGQVWQGIAILLATIIIISNVDNLLRPRLVGREAGMHDLMIFFSTLGGLSAFGIMGFIVGPVIAVFFLTILEIYSIEFKSTLDLAQNASLSPGEETTDT